MDENVPFVLFNPEGKQEGQLNNEEILDSMKSLHPEAYSVITERMDAAQRPAPEPEGFLDVPAEDVEEIQEEEVLMDEKEGMI